MGYRIFIAVMTLTLTSFSQANAADSGGDSPFSPKIVNVELSKAFIPIGFDDNDRVQFVVEGSFSNTCYKIGPSHFHMDEVNKTISVQQTAYQYFGVCLQMMVPFSQVIDLGPIRNGEWRVSDAVSGRPLGSLPVNPAKTAAADDYLYAPVTEAYVHKDPETFRPALSFMGTFTDRCTRLKEVQVHYYEDVLVVQPIAEHLGRDNQDCGPQLTRYSHTVLLKEGLKGTYLLHVRAMNGQAINKLVEIPQ